MNELGLGVADVLPLFTTNGEAPYVFVEVSEGEANRLAALIPHAVRRCYVSDGLLAERVHALEEQLGGTQEFRQAEIIRSKLPDPGSTMAGDFGEILVYFYQAVKANPQVVIGAKRWRLKQDRTKPAPGSDVVQFILPSWPTPSAQDVILCAEVKSKSTSGTFSPIEESIKGCLLDRTSRLSRTLTWLREHAIEHGLGTIRLEHLNRFIYANDHPPAIKRFRAVAVICASLLSQELEKPRPGPSQDYELVIISVPALRSIYMAVFDAARSSTISIAPVA